VKAKHGPRVGHEGVWGRAALLLKLDRR